MICLCGRSSSRCILGLASRRWSARISRDVHLASHAPAPPGTWAAVPKQHAVKHPTLFSPCHGRRLCSQRKGNPRMAVNDGYVAGWSGIARLHTSSTLQKASSDDSADDWEVEDEKYRELISKQHLLPSHGHQVFVLQPEVKHGPRRESLTTPQLLLDESCALVETLPAWRVVDKAVQSTKQIETKHLFGKGTFAALTYRVKGSTGISAVFVNVDMLSEVQLATLQHAWKVPVFDRYTIVLQIFRLRARTKEAKLQVALAEIPYFRTRMRELHDGSLDQQRGGLASVGGSGETFISVRQRLLKEKELKIRKALAEISSQREVLRKERRKKELPLVAVVGYTNAGKTSLIKALTGDQSMEPHDQLFATLDVTAHAGRLPNMMKVLYMDTVGFLSHLPTTLVESFRATLEELHQADAIVHVRDVSHPDTEAQRVSVVTTLRSLNLPPAIHSKVIEVGNKADLLDSWPAAAAAADGCLYISATRGHGLAELQQQVQTQLMSTTDRVHKMLKIPMNGPHLSWLYKEASVRETTPHDSDTESLLVDVVMTTSAYKRFCAKFKRSGNRSAR